MARYIGLDLGGTNIKAGVVDEAGRPLAKTSVPTGAEGGPDAVIKNMADVAAKVTKEAGLSLKDIDYVGIGAPGPINVDEGIVMSAPNMPGWSDVPLRDRIGDLIGRPTMLENDGNAAAFGEFWAGAGRDPAIRHMTMLTLGTGIGSGIIVDGRIVHGAWGRGGEAGHLIVMPGGRQCGCGQKGCLETYASASRTGLRAAEAIEAGETSSLRAVLDKNGEITAKDVFDAAKSGDAVANRILDETVLYLGIACVNMCRLFDPQMIVFAGGMILAGDYLFDMIRARFAALTWKAAKEFVQIVPAQLGNAAGFIGAAAVAWDKHQQK